MLGKVVMNMPLEDQKALIKDVHVINTSLMLNLRFKRVQWLSALAQRLPNRWFESFNLDLLNKIQFHDTISDFCFYLFECMLCLNNCQETMQKMDDQIKLYVRFLHRLPDELFEKYE